MVPKLTSRGSETSTPNGGQPDHHWVLTFCADHHRVLQKDLNVLTFFIENCSPKGPLGTPQRDQTSTKNRKNLCQNSFFSRSRRGPRVLFVRPSGVWGTGSGRTRRGDFLTVKKRWIVRVDCGRAFVYEILETMTFILW